MSNTNEGLRGINVGKTKLCTVGKSGSGLTYLGYDIKDLAENATFEEVAYLLLYGEAPTKEQLDGFKNRLMAKRDLPDELRQVLKLIPKNSHPMDVMRTGCSFLGNLETEKSFEEQYDAVERMLAVFPSIINYWYQYSHSGKEINVNSNESTIAGYFLHTLNGKAPSELEQRVIDVSLILYAEHELNASTFNARVCAATLSDIHSAISGAIGTLRGPLHGGANEAAMDMLDKYESVEDARNKVYQLLKNKVKIMGFGHAVYKKEDPRNPIIKSWSKKLSEKSDNPELYEISCEVERVMADEKGLFANADFFHASAYRYLGIPTKLFTPIFVCSRLTGWAAHVFEQRADNKLIRPGAEYIGPDNRQWISINA